MIELFREFWAASGVLDLIALVASIAYVVLAARNSVWCFVFGAIGAAVWAWLSFAVYELWLDALLQVFYFIMSGYGIYRWRSSLRVLPKPSSTSPLDAESTQSHPMTTERPITRMSLREHGLLFALGIPLSLLFGKLFADFTPAAATYLDAFTTVFSVLATWLVVERKLENWLYWIVLDAAYIYLYQTRGAFVLSLIMIIYIVIAIFGYINWRRMCRLTPTG